MWMMLQHQVADDYIFASVAHTVRDFVEECLKHFDRGVVWEGIGIEERGRCRRDGSVLVEVEEALFRPSDPNQLVGDTTKAKSILGWQPEVSFRQLVGLMADNDRASVTGSGVSAVG